MDTDLAEKNDIYLDIRTFFDQIAILKAPYQRALRAILAPPAIHGDRAASKVESGFPLLDRRDLNIEPALPKAYFLDLLTLVEARMPHEARAIRYQVTHEGCFEKLLLQAFRQSDFMAGQPELIRFLLQETIHPLLEIQAARMRNRPELETWAWGYCPICGDAPLLGLLDAETRAKHLVCGACATRWRFSRHQCWVCGITGNIFYFTAQEDKHFRVETCAACKSYLKVMDQGYGALDKPAIQVHLTTLHLDMIAQDKGFAHAYFGFILPLAPKTQ
jgi:FdhE protein